MNDAIFKLPTPLLLSKVVDCLDQIYDQMEKVKDSDIRGDVYEYLLSKIAQSGLNGQFRTPRHIIKNALPERTKFYIRKNRIKTGHSVEIHYKVRLIS